jgi:co-chaperonin GroES (HSP10)
MSDYNKLAGGSTGLLTRVKGNVRPIRNRVIVSGMNFGEMKTKGGIVLTSDDGKDRGIKPRWGKVYSKGNENTDPYNIGDYILVEHGRWTRGFEVEMEDGTVKTMRTVEAESILGWQTEEPEEMLFGDKSDAGAQATIRPEDFGAR